MSGGKGRLPATRPDASYDIGYGKPPKHTRFVAGKSGNPRGRPKGAKNKRPALNEERLKDIVLQEAYRDISVRDGTRKVSMPMAQAVVRALAVNAAKGQHRAQRLFTEMLTTTERRNKELAEAWLNTAMDYKIQWDRELRRRDVLGITDLPEPLPHPDHVKIDMCNGTARIIGPMTAEEKAEYDDLVQAKQVLKEAIPDLIEALETEVDEAERADIQDQIECGEECLDLLTRAIPD